MAQRNKNENCVRKRPAEFFQQEYDSRQRSPYGMSFR